MKQIIFNGFYGYKNTGDDAFLEIAAWGNRFYWNNYSPAYFTGENLPTLQTPIQKVYRLGTSNKIFQKASVFEKSLKCDYFINAGGSVLSKISPLGNIAVANKANLFNQKLQHGAIGVSIGPFTSSKDEKGVIEYLKKLKFLALRDTQSYQYAKSLSLDYNPINAFDLAALLPMCYQDIDSPIHTTSSKTIGVSVCNYERYYKGDVINEKRRNDFVKDTLALLSKNKNLKFKFLVFNGNEQIGDYKLTSEIASKLPKEQYEIIPYMHNTIQVWQEIKSCDFIFSTRLHASVFACYANVPFMLIEYHRKCSDFLEDIGYNSKFRVFDGERVPQEVVNDIEYFLNEKFPKPSNIQETIERAKLNFTSIRL